MVPDQLPASLAAVLNDRLSSVSAETAQLLRTAALLGRRFTVADLAVLLRRPAWDLAADLQEAARPTCWPTRVPTARLLDAGD